MRTLLEIIEGAKEGVMPTHEECYYAMLAYEAMFNMDHRKLQEELLREKPTSKVFKEIYAENSFQMYKRALDKSPKDWLGPSNDPMTPECQERRKSSLAIWEKFQRGVSLEYGKESHS